MNPRDVVKIGVAAVMLLGAGALLASWLWPARAEAGQDVTCWLCTESSCGKEFTKDVLDLARLRQDNPDANPPCPKCGKATTIRAVPCPLCGTYLKPLSHGRLPKTCTKCGKTIVETPTPAPAAATPTPAPAGSPAPAAPSK
jgi:hypothetical protein